MTLSEAIRACYAGRLTQEQLAAATGIPQQTISRLARGDTEPRLPVLKQIEHACGRPVGWIAAQAGYVDEVTTVRQAIEMDPALPDGTRRLLIEFYETALKTFS